MSTFNPPPTHPFAGSDSDRQSVGDPGHCELCAVLGHARAHPDLGCGDVGCNRDHSPNDPSDIGPLLPREAEYLARLGLLTTPKRKA